MSAEAVFSAWLADAPAAAVGRAAGNARLLAAAYAEPAAFKDGRLAALEAAGVELWSLVPADAVSAGAGGRVALNASRQADLRGSEDGLERAVRTLLGQGAQVRLCLTPDALDPAAGKRLALAGAGLMLCLAPVPSGGPGALLGGLEQRLRPWVEAVDPSSLEVVLPGHGWTWGPQGAPERLSWDAWTAWTRAHGPERRDPASAELNLAAEGSHAWIVDSIGYSAKLWTLRELGLRRFCVSGLGQEDPRLWALVDTLPQDFIQG